SEQAMRGPTVIWLSDELLLAQTATHRDFRRIDLAGHEGAPLLGALEKLGWAFSPALSHDGKQIAFYWNREDVGRSIWIIPAQGGAPRKILAPAPYTFPLSWSKG